MERTPSSNGFITPELTDEQREKLGRSMRHNRYEPQDQRPADTSLMADGSLVWHHGREPESEHVDG